MLELGFSGAPGASFLWLFYLLVRGGSDSTLRSPLGRAYFLRYKCRMSSRYNIPQPGQHRSEEIIKRSRFIATVAWAPDVGAAKAFIGAIKAEFSDATHNCWAYAAGPPGDTAAVGFSDDGEPHGTAGRPMLNALLHSGIGEAAVVVTRYFGGVKLGSGGLVRAYSGATVLGLEATPLREKITPARLKLSLDYTLITQFKRALEGFEAVIIEEAFTDTAGFCVELPEERAESFAQFLTDLSHGKACVERI